MPFVKGKSGNPAGTTKAQSHNQRRLARLVGEITGDGEELIRRLILLSRGVTSPEEMTDAQARDGRTKALTPERIKIALQATQELMDRLAGKAPQHIELDVDSGASVEDTARAVLREMTAEQVAAIGALEAGMTLQ